MQDFKPWWEKVADFNDVDQQEFLRGAFQTRITYRPRQLHSHVLGLIAGYKNRKFVQPESYKGRQSDDAS